MTSIQKPGWSFYAAWIVLTGLSVPVGLAIYFILSRVIIYFIGDTIFVDGVRHITEDYIAVYVIVPAAGLVMGLLQAVLLQRYLHSAGWWALATIFGFIVGWLLVFGLMAVVSEIWSMEVYFDGKWSEYVSFLQLGLFIGVWQWLILRRYVPNAWWWIVANVAGWGFFALLFVNADSLGIEALVLSRPFGRALAFAVWMLPGCVTALTLAVFFNQNLERSEPGMIQT